MKKIILILFSFCFLFQGCKNEPKEQLQLDNKMYLISGISKDSIIVFGSKTLDSNFIDFYKVDKVLFINEMQLTKIEKVIMGDIFIYAKKNDILIYKRIKNLNFTKLKRQYISFFDIDGNKKLMISFWNPDYNNDSKFLYDKVFKKFFVESIFSLADIFVFGITIDLKENKIIEIREY